MIFHMKKEMFSWVPKITIKDEMDNDRYYVKGESFSLGHKLHVYNMDNQEVAFIKQKHMTLLPLHEVYLEGRLAMVITTNINYLSLKCTLAANNWTVEGGLWTEKFVIKSSNTTVAKIVRPFLSVGICHHVDINNSADELLVLCTVLVIQTSIR
jgi:uncharacterized protein YxjI